jgi:ABC-type Fe3+-siderophore transport system permease subunit
MVEVDTRQIALLIAIALLLMALVGPASAQVQAVQVTQDTVDDAQDATQDTVDDAQDATQDTVDDAQGTAGQAVDRAKKTKADHKKVGALQGDPSEGDEDDLSELIDEGQSIGGTFQAEDEPEPRQTSPLDRVREMFDLPITGLELLLMVAIGVALAIVGVALWRLARRPAARTSRREIKHS